MSNFTREMAGNLSRKYPREKIIVLINNSFLKRLGYSVDEKEIEEALTI